MVDIIQSERRIKLLEAKTDVIIKNILRDFMARIDYSNFDDSFDDELYYFKKLAERPIIQTVTVSYNAGYRDANTLIKNKMRTAAAIDKTTVIMMIAKSLTDKLQGLTESNKEEIQEKLIQHQTEQFTYDQIVDDMMQFFDYDTIAASRFARTGTNFVYNRAHLNRYRDTGIVPGVRYAAHLDERTSEICRMLNGTIWEINDPNISTPPNHFNCVIKHTKIMTKGGEKNIDDVKIGEMVLTHKMRYRPVTASMIRTTPLLYKISTNERSIYITGEHPIMKYRYGEYYSEWTKTNRLNIYDFVVVISENTECIEMINNIEKFENPDLEVVYNISVLEDESYIANGFVSHNCRSRILPYFKGIPGERDYTKDFDPEFIAVAEETLDTFHTKYWDI